MLKRTIQFTDFDGNEQVEVHYFNLMKTELIEMEVEHGEGLEGMIRRIIETNDKKAIIAEFKKIILVAYGQKSADGKRFIKSPEISTEFSQSPAFDALFMELATDDKAAADFITKVVPAGMSNVDQDKPILPPPSLTPAESTNE